MMRQITLIDDTGRTHYTYTISIPADTTIPPIITKPEPAEDAAMIFYRWWVDQTKRRSYPLPDHERSTAVRLARSLLRRYTLNELKEYGVHFFLEFGHELKVVGTLHLPTFISKLPVIIEQLRLRNS